MKNSGKRTIGKTLFTIFFVIPVFLVVEIPIFCAGALLGAFAFYSRDLPKIPELKQYQPKTVSVFYADDGTVIGIFYKERRFVVDLDEIPPHVVNAFIASEDARFYDHNGVDWRAMGRALVRNLKALRFVEGGSTITMQVTRAFLLTSEKSIPRKIKEILLATRLEELWGKKRILNVYLNEIYLGEACYGVEAAARNYFNKPVARLTIAEAAVLAGLVPSPVRYNPFKSVDLATARQRTVLDNMLRVGFITPEQYEAARREKPDFRKEEEVSRPFDVAPDFAEEVRRYIVEKYGAERLYNEGLKVFTTVNIEYQRRAIEALRKGLEELKARHKHFAIIGRTPSRGIAEFLRDRSIGPLKKGKFYQAAVTNVTRKKNETIIHVSLNEKVKGQVKLDYAASDFRVGHLLAVRFERFSGETPFFTLDDKPEIQGALVAIENRTGYVRALVGGASGEHFKFNRATQAKRQPGSAFKPIIYAAALEKKGYSPATIIVDEPVVIELEARGQEWEPRNAAGNFLGPISLRRALELSRNICTAKLLIDVGLDPVLELARGMGIKSELGRNISLSLGTSEVTLFELTGAYTVFANQGAWVEPVLVKTVQDRFGNVLEDNTGVAPVDPASVPTPVQREELAESDAAAGLPEDPEEEQPEFDDGDADASEEDAPAQEPSGPSRSKGKGPTGHKGAPPVVSGGAGNPLAPTSGRAARPVLSPQTAYIVTNLLQGVLKSGTGARIHKFIKRKDLAGKTGTTNRAADAWFIGFTPDMTAGVWVGFDEKRPLGRREEGGRSALPIWAYFMQSVLEGRPDKPFPAPSHIAFVDMLTYDGNEQEGFAYQTVREPIYVPLLGKTLVLCPKDTPEALNTYQGETFSPSPDQQPAPGYVPPPYVQPPHPGQFQPIPPGTVTPLHPSRNTGEYPPTGRPVPEQPGPAFAVPARQGRRM